MTSLQPHVRGDQYALHSLEEVVCRCLILPTAILAISWVFMPQVVCAQLVRDSIPLTYDDGNGNTLLYRLFLPPDYDDPGKSFPLTVFLHGSGQQGSDNVSQLLFIDGLSAATQSEQFASFLLVPQAQLGQGGWGPLTRGLTKQVMEQLEQQYSIDPARRYLTGLSMGGFGTWAFMEEYPDLFEAAAPMSAWGNPNAAEQYLQTRVWSFHGRADDLPASFNRATILSIKEAGGSPLYTETSGGHVIWEPLYNDFDQDLYSWMFEGVRPSMGTLIYDPQTGSTKIDARSAPGGVINFFLFNSSPALFNIPDTVYLDGVAIDSSEFFSAANTLLIRYSDTEGPGFSGLLELGNLLPTGLSYDEIHDLFINKAYRSPSKSAIQYFNIEFAIPEPSTLLLGTVAILIGCGSRKKRS